jgi:hypothetical protein
LLPGFDLHTVSQKLQERIRFINIINLKFEVLKYFYHYIISKIVKKIPLVILWAGHHGINPRGPHYRPESTGILSNNYWYHNTAKLQTRNIPEAFEKSASRTVGKYKVQTADMHVQINH